MDRAKNQATKAKVDMQSFSPAFELLLKFVKERERNPTEEAKNHGANQG